MSWTPATPWWPGNQDLSVPMGPGDAQHEIERPGEGAMKPTVTDPSDRSRTSDHWRPSDAVSSPGTAPRIQFRNGLKSDSASAAGVAGRRRVRPLLWHLGGGTVPLSRPSSSTDRYPGATWRAATLPRTQARRAVASLLGVEGRHPLPRPAVVVLGSSLVRRDGPQADETMTWVQRASPAADRARAGREREDRREEPAGHLASSASPSGRDDRLPLSHLFQAA